MCFNRVNGKCQLMFALVWAFSCFISTNCYSAVAVWPVDGSTRQALDGELTWQSTEAAATARYLYFGDNFEDVNLASDPNMLPCRAVRYTPVEPVKDPVLWYKFDETSGSTAADEMHNSEGRVTSSSGWDPNDGYDNSGCLHFDGTFRLDLENEPNVFTNAQNSITFSLWLKGDDDADYTVNKNIFSGKDSNNNLATVFRCPQPITATGDITFRYGAPDYDMVRWSRPPESYYKGQWHHYALVKDASAGILRIYCDGLLKAELTDAINEANITIFTIGASPDSTSSVYEGRIDDFRIYDYILNPAEIAALAYRPGQIGEKWTDPYGLDHKKTYCWRVDEINENTGQIWKGPIWQFSTEKYLPEDVDDDNDVDLSDIQILANYWLDSNEPGRADINLDGTVNLEDYARLASKWDFSGTTYYISSTNGNDNNDGLSPDHSWQSLNTVNSRTFGPGDKILFEAGTQYTGRLVASGSGAQGFPIIVDIYGGTAKARIDAPATVMEALLLENVQYWELNNLELTNADHQVAGIAGVRVHINNFGKAYHIYLRNLYVHDVNGPYSNDINETGYGIYWRNEGNALPSVFDDLRIEDCHVAYCYCRGIQGGTGYDRTNWHVSTNVVIRNNLVEQIGGAGITTIGTHGCLIEYNRVDNIGTVSQGNGIHPWSSDNTIMQFNEVSRCRGGTTEGWGFNSDGNCRNTLIQYNYSHDNEGGFQLIIAKTSEQMSGNTNTIIRYNISQNDGYDLDRDWTPTFNLSGCVRGAYIYNNTIYVGTRKEPIELIRFKQNSDGYVPDDTHFYNNIFYVDGTVTFTWSTSTNNYFSNNVWYGNIIDPPYDPCGITDDPLLVDPNSGGENLGFNWDLLDGYHLQAGSPCIQAGKIPDVPVGPYELKNGNRDFWGNPIPQESPPDIGAHQYLQPLIKR